jgi:hypothetical protein
MLLSLCLSSQDVKKLLQENVWQTTEDIASKHTKPILIKISTDSIPEFKLRFLMSDEIEYIKITKSKEYDLEGNEIPPGTYFISAYSYQIKNNVLKVVQKTIHNLSSESHNKAYYYKVVPKEADKSVELIPASEKEFKQ